MTWAVWTKDIQTTNGNNFYSKEDDIGLWQALNILHMFWILTCKNWSVVFRRRRITKKQTTSSLHERLLRCGTGCTRHVPPKRDCTLLNFWCTVCPVWWVWRGVLKRRVTCFNTSVAMLTSQPLTAFPNHSQFFKRLFSATKANAKTYWTQTRKCSHLSTVHRNN